MENMYKMTEKEMKRLYNLLVKYRQHVTDSCQDFIRNNDNTVASIAMIQYQNKINDSIVLLRERLVVEMKSEEK